MKKRYFIMKNLSYDQSKQFESIDIVYEENGGFTWVGEFGAWASESAQEKAKKILDILNKSLESE